MSIEQPSLREVCWRSALTKVPGRNTSERSSRPLRIEPLETRESHVPSARFFCITAASHAFGSSGPSHFFDHLPGTLPLSSACASAAMSGVSSAVP